MCRCFYAFNHFPGTFSQSVQIQTFTHTHDSSKCALHHIVRLDTLHYASKYTSITNLTIHIEPVIRLWQDELFRLNFSCQEWRTIQVVVSINWAAKTMQWSLFLRLNGLQIIFSLTNGRKPNYAFWLTISLKLVYSIVNGSQDARSSSERYLISFTIRS